MTISVTAEKYTCGASFEKSDFWEIQRITKKKLRLLLFFLFVFYCFFFYIFSSAILILIFQMRNSEISIFGEYNFYSNIKFIIISCAAGFILTFAQHKHSQSSGIGSIIKLLRAYAPDKDDLLHQQVKNILDESKIASGYNRRIDLVIIPTLAKNIFCLSISGMNLIGLSEGLLFKLTRDELQAVISQRLAYIANGDAEIMTFICATQTFLQSILTIVSFSFLRDNSIYTASEDSSQENLRVPFFQTIILSVIVITAKFIIKFLATTISRNRENFADAAAIQYTRNPMALASGLYKIKKSRLSKSISLSENLSPLFIVYPEKGTINENNGFFADFFSTHPPIRDRLSVILSIAGYNLEKFNLDNLEKSKETFFKYASEKLKNNDGSETDYFFSRKNIQGTDLKIFFYAYNNNVWEGPFTMRELFDLPYVMDNTYINPAGTQKVDLLKRIIPNRIKSIEKNENSCPRCGDSGGILIDAHYEFTPLQKCKKCNGHLIHQQKIIRIINRNIERCSDSIKILAKDYEKYILKLGHKLTNVKNIDSSRFLTCPKCNIPMIRTFYNYVDYIVIDFCNSCSLVWFDDRELEMLQYYVEKRTAELERK